jgi:hypothetical protein
VGKHGAADTECLMDQKFGVLVETLAPKLERLLAMQPLARGALAREMPKSGVYLFTERGRLLYVGRSKCSAGAARPPLPT